MAPDGEVDRILETVVNNLLVTNKLDIAGIRCRVLLTTPLESFVVGPNDRREPGLLDVLPDEATLAAVLAHELAHIVLQHSLGVEYSSQFSVPFSDLEIFTKLDFSFDPAIREQFLARPEGRGIIFEVAGSKLKSSFVKISRSEKGTLNCDEYSTPSECCKTMCASSCASTAASVASSGSTSRSPRLTTIVRPTTNDSSGVVSKTRQRIPAMSSLLVTRRLLTTVSRIDRLRHPAPSVRPLAIAPRLHLQAYKSFSPRSGWD